MEFMERGKNGESIVFRTESGDFYTPKALNENFIEKKEVEEALIQAHLAGYMNCCDRHPSTYDAVVYTKKTMTELLKTPHSEDKEKIK